MTARAARWRIWLTLALPFAFFGIPLAAGYSWSAIGPTNPVVPPVPGTESYAGRRPALPITMEYYGAGVVVVPFRAHLRAYLQNGDLPLWNPYAALGQPLAAQAEGGPYSPLALARALLPPTWANGVTVAGFLLSAVALLLLLRRLGLSAEAGALGGAAWAFSGALTLHIPRDNLADQVATIPPLFLAATWAIQSRRPLAYALFALAAGLHGLAGFLPIAVNALLLLVAYTIVLSLLYAATLRARIVTAGSALGALAVGLALTGPYTLPIAEAIQVAHTKNFPFLAFIPMPTANVVAIFFPLLFGQPLNGWLAGSYPDVADWNNLFSYGSTGLLLLAVSGLAALGRQPREQRILYLFFIGGTLFFVARYVSFPPLAAINALPILSQQSPKHTNGVTVFCLVVAAAFGAEWLRRADRRWTTWLTLGILAMAVSTVLTLMGRRGANLSVDANMAGLYVGVTLAILFVVLYGLWRARAARTDTDAVTTAAAVVVGELSVYLPLGNGEPVVLAWRLAIFGLIVGAGLLAARRAGVLAGLTLLAALVVYTGVVLLPAAGLPSRQEDAPPAPHLTWLGEAATGYRVFGIQPDYAGTARIQDIEAVGPLATREYLSFLELISSPKVFETAYYGSTFSLIHPHEVAPLYDLVTDYPRAKRLLDWLGVRYIVLEHRVFGPEGSRALVPLAARHPDLNVAYRDAHVTVVESPGAQPKAVFALAARRIGSAAEAVSALRADPAAIDGRVLVEAPSGALGPVASRTDGPAQLPVRLDSYRPNQIGATIDAPSAGVFVVKDSYFPGWQATLDGRPVDVVRVNGMVRGVVVPTAGRHEIVLWYRPISFMAGLAIGASALGIALILVGWDLTRRRHLTQSDPASPSPAQPESDHRSGPR